MPTSEFRHDDLPDLPPISDNPTRDEVAHLVDKIKHDLVGYLQSLKMGVELLQREKLNPEIAQAVIGLLNENLARSFAYSEQLAKYARGISGPEQ